MAAAAETAQLGQGYSPQVRQALHKYMENHAQYTILFKIFK